MKTYTVKFTIEGTIVGESFQDAASRLGSILVSQNWNWDNEHHCFKIQKPKTTIHKIEEVS